ncbi:MAG: hypothetical protein GWO04_07890 [Actinobacteria bacterium]|nr:hypothetical protein [Actinomycetota bacterium]
MLRILPRAAFAAVVCLCLTSAGAAQAPLIDGFGGTVDYGTSCLSPNDDGSSAEIDITSAFPGGLRFFDTTHNSIFVNTNGNISFSDRLSTYTPDAFPVADRPMIAPYWGDVDIRRLTSGTCQGSIGVTCTVCSPCHNPTENGVWWHLEAGRLIVTWDRVGYYNCNNDLRMSFQLILTAVEGCGGAGDFDVEFRYNRCEWETGDASDGSGGFGGTEAQAGFDAGNGTDFVEIMGSRDAGIANRLCTQSNVGETGVWRFQIRSGTVLCPDAGDACDTGMMGVCGEGLTNCVGSGTECQPVVTASPERCDALDNDCDGSTDEGDALCPGLEMCDSGVCIDVCFEGSCPEGEVCSASGRCVEAACDGVDCPEGQRCEGGTCIGACDGVVCPAGQECRAGRCLDACDSLSCDPECQVCQDGACVPRCEFAPCPSGEACLADGRCVEAACADVTCGAGEYCEGGSCIDACADAVCPDGQACMMGECTTIPMTTPDGGPPSGLDAGPGFGTDLGGSSDPDGGSAGADMGRVIGDGDGGAGCACRSTGSGASGSLWTLLVLGLLARRRRR